MYCTPITSQYPSDYSTPEISVECKIPEYYRARSMVLDLRIKSMNNKTEEEKILRKKYKCPFSVLSMRNVKGSRGYCFHKQ